MKPVKLVFAKSEAAICFQVDLLLKCSQKWFFKQKFFYVFELQFGLNKIKTSRCQLGVNHVTSATIYLHIYIYIYIYIYKHIHMFCPSLHSSLNKYI